MADQIDKNEKKEKEGWLRQHVGAIIQAAATIIAPIIAVLAAYLVAERTAKVEASAVATDVAGKAIDKKVKEISSGQLIAFAPNETHIAKRAGLVVVYLHASNKESMPRAAAFGYVGRESISKKEKIAGAIVTDQTVNNVSSISETSFTMPVPKGEAWRVNTENKRQVSHVSVRWFSPVPLASGQ